MGWGSQDACGDEKTTLQSLFPPSVFTYMSSKDGTLVAKLAHQVLLSMKPSLPDQSLFLKQVSWNWGSSSEVEQIQDLEFGPQSKTKPKTEKLKATKTSLKRFLHFTCALLKLAIMRISVPQYLQCLISQEHSRIGITRQFL